VNDDYFTLQRNIVDYLDGLGRFWHAFNGLELQLRLYLCGRAGIHGAERVAQLNANEGDEVPDNPMTDYRTFGQLCDAFNNKQEAGKQIPFDEYVRMRDALAHGRVTGDAAGRMTVIKYSKPKHKKVRVEFKRELSPAELKKAIEKMEWIAMEVSRRNGAVMPPWFDPNKYST
jgi:hypothetical protein